ncbi:MAG: O-methyltransferase [Anaerolineales bacterium]|jgi:predicted O-methyltransferase YrrM
MFHNIPKPILTRMRELEAQDELDREDGTPHLQRLRQIPPVTGKFLALLCASTPKGGVLEVGTSGGYSSLWLSLACRERGDHLTTFEILEEKVARANETFEAAEVSDQIQLIHGDAREVIDGYRDVAFCFLDAGKDVYIDVYEKVVPNLASGGILAADNVLSHANLLSDFVAQAEDDARVDVLVVPIGKGILVCRKL